MTWEARYRLFFTGVFLMLITCAVYLGVSLLYSVLSRQLAVSTSRSQPARAAVASPVRQKTRPFSHYRTIVERNLFQTQKTAGKPEKQILLEELDATTLDLTLWGTVVDTTASSYAVIEESGGKRRGRPEQKLFHVGDEIQDAVIKQILDEKVILTRNGKDEILEMEKFQSRRGARVRPQLRSKRPRTYNRTLRRSQIDNAMKNLSSLMRQIRVRPHPDGIQLSRVRPRSIFRRMGLRNGDIITSVDGRRIESVENALQLYDQLQSSSQVRIDLKRRGRERTINYTIK